MAGRGCTVEVRLLTYDDVEEADVMSLPVALHSPLDVFKDLLANITSIPPNEQVLILCDLDDPDRNNDKLLEENTNLRDCGIQRGSVLTLHGLGMDNDMALQKRKETLTKKTQEQTDPTIKTIDTYVPPERADHSYNGVIFGVKSNDAHAIEITSMHTGGMLGRVRIFARDRPWSVDNDDAGHSTHYWAYNNLLSETGWTLVADQVCRPSWDRLTEIKFDIPLCLLPHECKALYCHSGLPDDLGIQYQSYRRKNEIFAKDEHLTLMAGLGHTGSEPFETENGWYRNWRGMAGRLSYRPTLKGWTPWEHSIFPKELKEGVMTMLLTHNRTVTGLIQDQLELQRQHETTASALEPALYSQSEVDLVREEEELMMAADDGAMSTEDARDTDVALMRSDSLQSVQSNASTLSMVDHGTVYNIMEYMHWDWFKEAKVDDYDDDDDDGAGPLGSAAQEQRRRTPAEYSNLQQFLFSMMASGNDEDSDDDGGMSEQQTQYVHALLSQLGEGFFGGHYANAGGNSDDDDDDDDDDDEIDGDDEPDYVYEVASDDNASVEDQEEEGDITNGGEDDDTVEVDVERDMDETT